MTEERSLRQPAIGCALLVVFLVAVYSGIRSIPVSYSYGVVTEFDVVPPNDQALDDWIRAQPGVVVHMAGVNRTRVGERWLIEVNYGISRNGWGEPPLPDLDAACAALGYRGQAAPFRSVP
jgi:hypothetical protein